MLRQHPPVEGVYLFSATADCIDNSVEFYLRFGKGFIFSCTLVLKDSNFKWDSFIGHFVFFFLTVSLSGLNNIN